jgi:hypothetical protein
VWVWPQSEDEASAKRVVEQAAAKRQAREASAAAAAEAEAAEAVEVAAAEAEPAPAAPDRALVAAVKRGKLMRKYSKSAASIISSRQVGGFGPWPTLRTLSWERCTGKSINSHAALCRRMRAT